MLTPKKLGPQLKGQAPNATQHSSTGVQQLGLGVSLQVGGVGAENSEIETVVSMKLTLEVGRHRCLEWAQLGLTVLTVTGRLGAGSRKKICQMCPSCTSLRRCWLLGRQCGMPLSLAVVRYNGLNVVAEVENIAGRLFVTSLITASSVGRKLAIGSSTTADRSAMAVIRWDPPSQ